MKEIQKFVEAVKTKFKKYFLAYGIKTVKGKTFVQVIIDDRDVKKIPKKELLRKLDVLINAMLFELLKKEKSKEKAEAKVHLLSDLNQGTVWQALGDSATVMDVKSMAGFIQLNLPDRFLDAYDRLQRRFKLSDLKREFELITNRKYHRNTYQNWLGSLQKIKFVRLEQKYYQKLFRGLELSEK